eukprot:scaffold318497_cov44-Prasinocladus_malaysianus.AAC.1
MDRVKECNLEKEKQDENQERLAYVAHLGADDGREADVVLLDDGGVQRVEVQQQDVLVVQALLWLQHQPARVLRPLALLAVPGGPVAPRAQFLQPRLVLAAQPVGGDELAAVELVQQEHLNPLRPGPRERPRPLEAGQAGELAGEGQHAEVEHEPQGQPGVAVGVVHEAHEGVGGLEGLGNPAARQLGPLLPQQAAREGRQGVVHLLHKLPRCARRQRKMHRQKEASIVHKPKALYSFGMNNPNKCLAPTQVRDYLRVSSACDNCWKTATTLTALSQTSFKVLIVTD